LVEWLQAHWWDLGKLIGGIWGSPLVGRADISGVVVLAVAEGKMDVDDVADVALVRVLCCWFSYVCESSPLLTVAVVAFVHGTCFPRERPLFMHA
jgi:hypothetical protein